LGQGFTYDQLTPEGNPEQLSNGWPLFNKRYAGAFIAGFFNIQAKAEGTNFPELSKNGYDSFIASVPQWTTLSLSLLRDNKVYTLDPSLPYPAIGEIKNYAQNLSLSDGIVTTEFTWLNSIHVKYTVVAHKSIINLGVVDLQVTNLDPKATVELEVEDSIDFNSSHRCQLTGLGHDNNGIFMTFQPSELSTVNGAIYSRLQCDENIDRSNTNDTTTQGFTLKLAPGASSEISKYVGIVSSDLDPVKYVTKDDVLNFATQVAISNAVSVEKLIASHDSAWADQINALPQITFGGNELLTLAARSSIFHLAANTRPEAQGLTSAVGVGGLSSDSYAGLVFWDADLWMMNGVLPFMPLHAKSFVNYRLHTHEQAKENVPQGFDGAVYPWTSGRYGNCTATGPCIDYEYHINMAVAQSAWHIYLSGAADDAYLESVVYPLVNDAATFYADYLVHYDDNLGKYTTHNLTDPDEYANHVDNGAYTNAGISAVMKWAIAVSNHLGKKVPDSYEKIVGNMYLATSDNADNITLEFSGMNSSVGVKQADVIMMTYPLEDELITQDQAYTNMEYYSLKQVSYGPAMTFPIFSTVASKLATSGCASQSYLMKSVSPFLRGPFAQFAEQNNDDFSTNGGTHPAFPFLTAHGGFLQSIVQGLTGLRFDYEVENGKLERFLNIDPVAIPCLGDDSRYDGIKFSNHSLSLEIHGSNCTITSHGAFDKSANDTIKIKIGDRNSKNGSYYLSKDESLTFDVFNPGMTYKSSISECKLATFTNITDGAIGDSAASINDGDNTTRWQAASNSTTAKLLIDLLEVKNMSSIYVNWGDKPAASWKVLALNDDYDFEDSLTLLSQVDFGNNLHQSFAYLNPAEILYNQEDIFQTLIDEKVPISAPFNQKEVSEVQLPSAVNSTTHNFDHPIQARFALIEAEGIHDEHPTDDFVLGGAKFYEVVFS
jgi:alpha,alpha-trehalase